MVKKGGACAFQGQDLAEPEGTIPGIGVIGKIYEGNALAGLDQGGKGRIDFRR